MKHLRAAFAIAAGAIALAGTAASGCGSRPRVARDPLANALPFRPVADVTLPGRPTRLDYQSLDPVRHLLFIAHMGDNDVVVVDTRTRRVVARIDDIPMVTGVLAVPERNTIYASAAGSDEVVAIDEATLRIVARTPGGIFPDGLSFDPIDRRIFVSDERGGTLTVIDADSNRRTGEIALGGDVGNNQYDPVSHHVFANIQGLRQLDEIDPRTATVLRRFPVASGCLGNHGLQIDPAHHRAFIACEDNGAFLWLDMPSLHVRKTWRIGDDPDVIALDPENHRLYVAAESGVVSIFDDGHDVRRLAQGTFASGAHTVAVDPGDHLVYFPLENVAGAPVLRIVKPQ